MSKQKQHEIFERRQRGLAAERVQERLGTQRATAEWTLLVSPLADALELITMARRAIMTRHCGGHHCRRLSWAATVF